MHSHEIIVTTYKHLGARNSVPPFKLPYIEIGTGDHWIINASGDLAYFVRIGDLTDKRNMEDEQRVDSDSMVRRLEAALLMAQRGFFDFVYQSSVLLQNVALVGEEAIVNCILSGTKEEEDHEVYDWYGALSKWPWLRRAAEDAHFAMQLPSESMFFTFRAFEWLQSGLNCPWTKLGPIVDVPQINLKRLKKHANSRISGARHGVQSGNKGRIGKDELPQWLYGLMHAVVEARTKIDDEYGKRIEADGNPFPFEWGTD